MTRRRKWLVSIGGVFFTIIAAAAVVLSYNGSCTAPGAQAVGKNSMQAIVQRCYGPPSTLSLENIPIPSPGESQVLVRVRAAAINPLDWHYMRGEPYLMRLSSGLGRPNDPRFGVDFAGTVEAVGSKVTRYKVGDEVFGARGGALAQFVLASAERSIARKPPNVTFEQAAAVPVAAITALQALRDKAAVKAGDKVLINGASGGVGTFAVQIAKSLGAIVTGVSSTRNLELVRSLGADQVIDYTQSNFTQQSERYDVIIDNVGNHGLLEYRRVLQPNGVVVIVGGPKSDPWLGPLVNFAKAPILSRFLTQRYVVLLAETNAKDLDYLRALMEAGQLRSVIDRRFTLAETSEAIAYLERGRTRGKVIVQIDP